jgi:general secretion pathway protein D
VSPLAATLNFKLQDTDANLLASPRIRARNKEKAKILIGDRVPTITNTVTPVQSGLPVITGSVTYQEVGLKLEFEPQIYSDHDVGIRIKLEVSNIVQEFTDPQGGRSYQIGTRNAETSLRLHDGETQILAGLISDQDRTTAAKVPGLGHLPMVGRLFGNNSGTATKTEIVLSITPHIVRAPSINALELREVFSGTESRTRGTALNLDPVGNGIVLVQPGSATGLAPSQTASAPTTSSAPVVPAQPVAPVNIPPILPPQRIQQQRSSSVQPAAPSPQQPASSPQR